MTGTISVEVFYEIMGYKFNDPYLLKQAFVAAHRDDENEDQSYDGNRKLAQTGTSLIDSVIVHETVVTGNQTRKYASIVANWLKSRDSRAAICDQFSLGRHIQCSPRQRSLPTPKVLATALSAAIGAISEDLIRIDTPTADYFRTLFKIFEGIRTRAEAQRIDPKAWAVTFKMEHPYLFPTSTMSTGISIGHEEQFDATLEPSCLTDGPDALLENSELGLGFFEAAMQSPSPPVCPSREDDSLFKPQEQVFPDTISVDDLDESYSSLLDFTDARESHIEAEICSDQSNKRQKTASDNNHGGRKYRKATTRKSQTAKELISIEMHKIERLTTLEEREKIVSMLDLPGLTRFPSDHIEILSLFYFAIGSCQSLAAFQAIVKEVRRGIQDWSTTVIDKQANRERLEAIERLEDNAAVSGLLRRYHVIQLFWELYTALDKTQDSFVVQTVANFNATGPIPGPGNPIVKAEGAAVNTLLRDGYSHLHLTDDEMVQKRQRITSMRRTAKRLYKLVIQFGLGILALLPPPSQTSGVSRNIFISDERLVEIPVAIFDNLIELIRGHQGRYLSQLCRKMEPIVRAICCGGLQSITSMELDEFDQMDFLNYVKGSNVLLRDLGVSS